MAFKRNYFLFNFVVNLPSIIELKTTALRKSCFTGSLNFPRLGVLKRL